MTYSPKKLSWYRAPPFRPNRALHDLLPVLQHADGPLTTTRIAKLIGHNYERAQRGLCRLRIMGIVKMKWIDRLDWKTHYTAREAQWELLGMEVTVQKEEDHA